MTKPNKLSISKLSDKQFKIAQEYLAEKYGLNLPDIKKTLLESRLHKRTKALGFPTTDHYIDFLFSFKKKTAAKEYCNFIDLVTTHKTSFFREAHQFDFLINTYLDQYLPKKGSNKLLKIWSAGCSTGEEVYSLAILLDKYRERNPAIDFQLFGTDISIPSLKAATKGIYQEPALVGLDKTIRESYFEKTAINGVMSYKFKRTDLKNKISFSSLNLNKKIYNIPFKFDFVFCRNVIIYFDIKTQKEVINRLSHTLKTDGILFLGHSESAIGSNASIKSIFPTSYQKL
ncbi:CheR family methyltransferase [Flammeovirgaceae bacterium SG7u.111]|nr:CheR family methyltransferase [Flammeovirgaceae bacterium SG7u.132]WPO34333.1 CheR family methyltransferase [Flammeovirgaceae bacterium SG7u.111]